MHKQRRHLRLPAALCALIFFAFELVQPQPQQPPSVDVTLVGAYGDLARKYLWKGFFELYLTHSASSSGGAAFKFYGAGRASTSTGNELLADVLKSVKFCESDNRECVALEKSFLSEITYVQLKSTLHYEHHCSQNLRLCSEEASCPTGQRIFYLSVPPFAYKAIAADVSLHCRSAGVELKLVVEKPFGHDYDSAAELASALSTHFEEHELYR